MALKLALPGNDPLRARTASLLARAGIEVEGYGSGARSYALKAEAFPYLRPMVLQERDIPIQVAVGNYALGICGRDWAEELVVKYPASSIVELADLGYGKKAIYAAVSKDFGKSSLNELVQRVDGPIRIVSSYPNLAEAFAIKTRLERFAVFPVQNRAEVYLPEHADLAILPAESRRKLEEKGLRPLSKILNSSAFLIANRERYEEEDVSEIVSIFLEALGG